MFLYTKRIKPQKLSIAAQRAIEDRDYWMAAYVEAVSEIRRLRRECQEKTGRVQG